MSSATSAAALLIKIMRKLNRDLEKLTSEQELVEIIQALQQRLDNIEDRVAFVEDETRIPPMECTDIQNLHTDRSVGRIVMKRNIDTTMNEDELVKQENPTTPLPRLSLEELKSKVPQILEQLPYIKLLVLFGSRARGDATKGSDWDFAVLYDEELQQKYERNAWEYFRIWQVLQNVYHLLDDELDIVDLSNSSELTAHNVAVDGKIIYERDPGEFARFQERSIMSRAELKALDRKYRDEIWQALKEWGL